MLFAAPGGGRRIAGASRSKHSRPAAHPGCGFCFFRPSRSSRDARAKDDLYRMGEPYNVVAVPGSTANLGPAFDALSVALNLHLRVRVLDVRADLAGAIEYEFDGAGPTGENRIDTAYQLTCQRFGRPVRGWRVRVASEIPIAAGLGSRAAATIAGARLYEAARAIPLDAADILDVATEIEGHPDNAAASLYGGITL